MPPSRLTRMFAPLALLALLAGAAGEASASSVEGTGLPLPRFVSLRAGKANLRTGPGVQYPTEWIYQKSGVPLEIIAEHKNWRKVRDWEGAQGWLHQSMVSSKRAVIILGKVRVIRTDPDERAAPVVQVEPGVVASLLACPTAGPWCRVEADGRVGWLRRFEFWGSYDDEVVE